MPTYTQPNARLKSDKFGRPLIHVLRFDEATQALRAATVVVPQSSTDDAGDKLYCLLVDGNGQIIVDSVDRRPVILDCPPFVVGIVDQPDRLMGRKEAARESGVSIPTLKRAENAGELRKTKISNRRVGYTVGEFQKWLSMRNAK